MQASTYCTVSLVYPCVVDATKELEKECVGNAQCMVEFKQTMLQNINAEFFFEE